MRTTKTIALVLAAIMLAVALSACSVNNPNYTVLKVGDMNIGVNAYYNNYNYLAQVYSMYGLYNVSTPEAFKRMQDQVFDNLINNALPVVVAKQNGVTLTEEEEAQVQADFKEQIDQMIAQYASQVDESITDEDAKYAEEEKLFKAALKSSGWNYNTYLKMIEDDVRGAAIGNKYMESLYSGVNVTEEDAKAYYDEQLAAKKAEYAETPAQFYTDYSNAISGSDTVGVLTVPEGYRFCKHILIKKAEEGDTTKNVNQIVEEVKAKLAGINGEVESSISGMRTAKAFANEAAESAKFDQANDQFRGAKRGYYRAMAFYQSGMEFFMGILSVVVIAFGGFLLMRGRMDLIDLTTFFLYISTFITPIRKLSAFVEQFMQGMAGFKRFVALMRVEPDIQDEPDAQELTDVKGDIRVEDVTFRYEPSDPPVLEHVTLHVRPGETVAVVGPSGGGKSTLCQLIPRFYDVTEGRVLVDGKDVRTLTQHSLRANIGIVQQDVFLFAGTIYDNIRYGRPDATEAEIVEAAKRAEIYDDILDMPDGFQTQVGERGAMLSGGQKQRVSIARIFLKDPPVLILDEATSALDSVTEARIQSAFDELAKGRTTLIIAHRLSTIRSASRILVIDGNGIQEEGTHEELMAKGGEYAQLYLAQKSVSV